MTIELLIQSIVRQTTVLIAQLATSGGARAPLAQVANQVFLDLVAELGRQGVSRKVSADMFGLGLRTYQRKIQRLIESSTEHGRSLWEAVLQYICAEQLATRASVHQRFAGDDDVLVRGVLTDLCESGLIFSAGQGPATVYRAASDDELRSLRQLRSNEGLDEFLWALVYREGPISRDNLASLTHLDSSDLESALTRLLNANRIEVTNGKVPAAYCARSLFVPVGAPVGWEAAVFDHYQAMVKTICCRLRDDREVLGGDEAVGGSTYTLDIWPGHPLEEEARNTLTRLRTSLVDLRQRVETINCNQKFPTPHSQLILYVGQCVIEQDLSDSG